MGNDNISLVAKISRFLLIFVGIDVILTSILFLFKVSICRLNLFIGFGIAIIIFARVSNIKVSDSFKICGISCLMLILIVVINSLLNEIAYDGNLYHKFAVGILKMGYNPVYDRVEDYLVQLRIPEESWYNDNIWVGCFPKVSWIFDATIYAVTNWIESAKVFNALIFISSLGICYDYFSYKLSKKWAIIISIIFVATPTSVGTVLTFYLDGALGNLLIMSIVLLMSITDEEYIGNKKLQFLYLAISIILCGNLKVTGLAYEAVFCFGFFIMWVVQIIKQKNDSKSILKIVGYYIATVAITVFIVGAGTWIPNIRNYGNVLYPLGAMEGFNVANNLKSVNMQNDPPLLQMLSMIFVKTNTNDSLSYLEWKIPFTFDINQIRHSVYDVIRGGTGIFYSGIFCIAIAMFVVWNWKFRKELDTNKKMVYMVMFISFILLCIVPAGGQTRYSPYVFYFVSFTVYLWMLKVKSCDLKNKVSKHMPLVMFILLMLNGLPYTNYYLRMVIETRDYNEKFAIIEEHEGVYIDTRLPGIVFNFIDRDIYYEYDTVNELNDGNMKYYWLDYNYIKD